MQPLDPEQQGRAVEALLLAEKIAARYARIFPEHEQDLLSAVNLGAVRAAATYIPKPGRIWGRWSKLCIIWEVKNFLGSADVRNRQRFRFRGDFEFFENDRGRSDADRERAEQSISLEWLMAKLPKKHRDLCGVIHRRGITAGEAGVVLGYSINHGDKLFREAVSLLREQIAA